MLRPSETDTPSSGHASLTSVSFSLITSTFSWLPATEQANLVTIDTTAAISQPTERMRGHEKPCNSMTLWFNPWLSLLLLLLIPSTTNHSWAHVA
uniref:Secreted protein n=1 Tax=Mesocestoides corti TaxID=53468 RepID=A0A5K3FUD5_MESCO